MKLIIISVICFTVFRNNVGYCDVVNKWSEFQMIYNRTYSSDLEVEKRFKIFQSNLNEIEKHNAMYREGRTTHTKTVNQFADWTNEEFINYLLKKHVPIPRATLSGDVFSSSTKFNAPRSIDWRKINAVTDVKDQGILGSSWAYSVTGSIEGQLGINKALVSLSEENLVDCTCEGGNDLSCINKAYNYIIKNGIERTEDYPHSGDGQCNANVSKIVAKISGYFNIQEGNEKDLQIAIATKGPISTVMEVTSALMLYSSGILIDTECNDSKNNLNHGVLVVGYVVEDTHEYYIVKNSWGSTWGENSYFRLIRNRNDTCGIASFASYPVL